MSEMIEVANLISKLFWLYGILLLVWAVLSWIPQIDRYHPVVRALDSIIEPTVAPFRRLMPSGMGIDFSPLIAYFVYSMLVRLVVTFLVKLSYGS